MRLRVELPEKTLERESDVALFRVGRADTCALRFEGAAAKYSSWEHAEFRRDDEGNTYVSDFAHQQLRLVGQQGPRNADEQAVRALQIGDNPALLAGACDSAL